MATERNPQAQQMADESMVRTLAAQADAIWPQESPLFDQDGLASGGHVLDVGCGTGELIVRLGRRFPNATFVGVDIVESHLELARRAAVDLGERASFEVRDAFETGFDDATFDLVTCRHMLQAVPDADQVIAELVRICKPGGRVHLLAEDYGMIHFAHGVQGGEHDNDRFWRDGPMRFGMATHTDLRIGLKAPTILRRLGLDTITTDYAIVDTLRVPRETFRAIWVAWRDGYSDAIAEKTDMPIEEVHEHWERMLAVLDDPDGYAVWHVPIIPGAEAGLAPQQHDEALRDVAPCPPEVTMSDTVTTNVHGQPVGQDVPGWEPARPPAPSLIGRSVRLERLAASTHVGGLHAALVERVMIRPGLTSPTVRSRRGRSSNPGRGSS